MNSYELDGNLMKLQKKKKKHKKDKKSKKHKCGKRKKGTSSSERSSDSDEMEWVEMTAEVKKPEVQREDWMCKETFVPTLCKEEMLGKDPDRRWKTRCKDQKQDLYQPGQHERELNPYWKNGGKGIPENNREDFAVDIKLPSTSVGDGGLSWLRKAYKRIEEQAKEEGRSMENIAAERWGSLGKLQSLIAEAEERTKQKPHCSSKHRESYHERQESKSHKRSHDKERDTTRKKNVETSDIRYNKGILTEKTYDRSMFTKPCQEITDEVPEYHHTDQNSRHAAWKKKRSVQESSTSDEHAKADQSLKNTNSSYSEKRLCSDDSTMEETVTLSENEMNNLAAKILKAEMRGNVQLAAQLQLKLDAARNVKKIPVQASSHAAKEEVILSKLDSYGIKRPLIAPEAEDRVNMHKRKGNSDRMSKIRSYFSENSEHSLKKMFEREKLTTSEDQIEMFVDAAAVESKGLMSEDYETGTIPAKVAKKMEQGRQDEKDYNKAIQEHKRLNTALERCVYCFQKVKKHLVVAEFQQAYLCLPSEQSLTEGHCLIVPKEHISTSLLLDEDVAEEIKNFKRILVDMFKEHDQCVAFVETCSNLKHSPHLVIECFPVPMDIGYAAPMYFKKAIQEQGSEWANNRKLIDLYKKDLKHSVPKGLPFFVVEFGEGGGYAHIIEDRDFPRHFGKEIIGGMLEIDSHLCARYKKEDFKDQAKKVLHFSKMWTSYTNKMNIAL